MRMTGVNIRAMTLAVLFAATLCFMATRAMAQSDVPETSIVPSDEGVAPPPPRAMPAPRPKAAPRMAAAPSVESEPARFEVEPAKALVRIVSDAPIHDAPSRAGKVIETAHAGKFIQVTGSTHYFLRVTLKSGEVGYLEPHAVELVKPTDKIFALTSNAAVLQKPNKWSKQLSEVHKGHNVHAVGVALNYVKIRMRSGLEGYIPMSALE
jgi:hypothetical protein